MGGASGVAAELMAIEEMADLHRRCQRNRQMGLNARLLRALDEMAAVRRGWVESTGPQRPMQAVLVAIREVAAIHQEVWPLRRARRDQQRRVRRDQYLSAMASVESMAS